MLVCLCVFLWLSICLCGNNKSYTLPFCAIFGSEHAIQRAQRRGDIQEIMPSERWIRGSPGSGSSSVSELRIRLEDGSVLLHTFPACKLRGSSFQIHDENHPEGVIGLV